jgi:hypothetical protein
MGKQLTYLTLGPFFMACSGFALFWIYVLANAYQNLEGWETIGAMFKGNFAGWTVISAIIFLFGFALLQAGLWSKEKPNPNPGPGQRC